MKEAKLKCRNRSWVGELDGSYKGGGWDMGYKKERTIGIQHALHKFIPNVAKNL